MVVLGEEHSTLHESRIEAHAMPLVRWGYFRNSWQGMVAGSGELLCSRVYVSEVSAPTTPMSPTPFAMRVAWA